MAAAAAVEKGGSAAHYACRPVTEQVMDLYGFDKGYTESCAPGKVIEHVWKIWQRGCLSPALCIIAVPNRRTPSVGHPAQVVSLSRCSLAVPVACCDFQLPSAVGELVAGWGFCELPKMKYNRE